MSEPFFLDTNILVYSFDRSSPRKELLAQHLINRAISTGDGIISYQVVQEFFSVALKRLATPMSVAEAQKYLATVFQPLLAVHSSSSLYSESLNLHASAGLSWFDALIVASAQQARCQLLYTEDLQHGQRFGNLRVVNPFL
jgi:predicted nucleic acid-binding protein